MATYFDGNYSITAQAGQILVFSSVGFQNQEVQLGDNTSLNITLQESFDFLDEIIVTGYGTQTRREVMASIVNVNSETIEKVASGNSLDAIKGQVAGVDITSAGGRPGQSPLVRIRVRRSISASNDPLYVIDWIPVTSSVGDGAIFDIAPQDIQSIEILKDAAATAIYGSRGANGVIIVTTKRGKAGEKTKISYWNAAKQKTVPYQVYTPDEWDQRTFPSLNKWIDNTRPNRQHTQGQRDFVVMRLADAYLIRAEARLKQGNKAGATTDINKVRTRAAWEGKEDEMQITVDVVDLDFILEERARELAGEGLRWYDLTRTGKLVELADKHNPEAKGNIKSHHVVRPIPLEQIDRTQGGYPQNSGYPQ